MKILTHLLILVVGLGVFEFAVAKTKHKPKAKTKMKMSAAKKQMQVPNQDKVNAVDENVQNPNHNSELPYSPDEMERNSAENYSTKNPQVDQD